MKLGYFSTNHTNGYNCTNETAPELYWEFLINGNWVWVTENTIAASREASDARPIGQRQNVSLDDIVVPVFLDPAYEVIEISGWISDWEAVVSDPVSEFTIRLRKSDIMSMRRPNGVIHSGIGLRQNDCNISFYYQILGPLAAN